MGIRGKLLHISPAELATLQQGSEEATNTFLLERYDAALDISAFSIGSVLKVDLPDLPLIWDMKRGTPLQDFHIGYGPVLTWTPQEVQQITRRLIELAEPEFRLRLYYVFYQDNARFASLNIHTIPMLSGEALFSASHAYYDERKREIPPEAEWALTLTHFWNLFRHLVSYLQDAIRAGYALLYWVS